MLSSAKRQNDTRRSHHYPLNPENQYDTPNASAQHIHSRSLVDTSNEDLLDLDDDESIASSITLSVTPSVALSVALTIATSITPSSLLPRGSPLSVSQTYAEQILPPSNHA
jgi:hypothetical protein